MWQSDQVVGARSERRSVLVEDDQGGVALDAPHRCHILSAHPRTAPGLAVARVGRARPGWALGAGVVEFLAARQALKMFVLSGPSLRALTPERRFAFEPARSAKRRGL